MKRMAIFDNPPGNALGWNPDGFTTVFTITQDITLDSTEVTVNLNGGGTSICNVVDYVLTGPEGFVVACTTAPSNLEELHYVVETLPPHLVLP
jgi:hypothetical protein